jgi:hypothetical protein
MRVRPKENLLENGSKMPPAAPNGEAEQANPDAADLRSGKRVAGDALPANGSAKDALSLPK